MTHSSKLLVLIDILRGAQDKQEKVPTVQLDALFSALTGLQVLVFTQSTQVLDVIEAFTLFDGSVSGYLQ